MKIWKVTVLTLFPEMFPGPLGKSIIGKALEDKKWDLNIVNIKDFSLFNGEIDNAPYGGGSGMVIRPDVLGRAYDSYIKSKNFKNKKKTKSFMLSPRGKPLDQKKVRELSSYDEIILVCGKYEGVDQRFIDTKGLEELSVGDYVLSGGEPAAIVVIDAVVRLLSEVLGSSSSLINESFEEGLLEYPQYTRPRVWEGNEVPEVLLSGNHKRIEEWRKMKSKELTALRRPDLCFEQKKD